MAKPNYQLKSMLFQDHPEWVQAVRGSRRYDYLIGRLNRYDDQAKASVRDPVVQKSLEELQDDFDIAVTLFENAPVLFHECEKIVDSDKQRKKRLRKRIERIMEKGSAYFVTLTFSDHSLASTDPKTRRTYVARFCKSISPDFVGNVDYGKQNGREHYHIVMYSSLLGDIKYKFTKRYGWVCSDAVQFADWSNYGFYSIKSCGTDYVDKQKLAWYVSKLTNHAIKETTKRSALIYSR